MTSPSPAPASATPQQKQKPLSKQLRLPAFMPFFWLGIATIVGAFLAHKLKPDGKLWLVALGFSLAGFIIDAVKQHRQKRRRKVSVFLILTCLCLSAFLYTNSLPKNTPQYVNYYNDKGTVNFSGLVVKPPRQKRSVIELTVRVESIKIDQSDENAQDLKGLILVEVPLGNDYKYGDRISVYGELSQPPEGTTFSYRDYLFHKGIYAVNQYSAVKLLSRGHGNPFLRALYALRERSNQVLQNNFPNPESALLRGILLGDESGISSELAQDYSRTGTSHIIAISGFNMVVLAGVVSAILRRRAGRLWDSLIAIAVLGAYTLFVGANPAVTRAFVMSAVAILGSSIARRGNLLNSLGLSVFIMVLIDPHLPWDIGFQFSVMATLSLSLFATPLQAWVEEKLQKRFPEEKARSIASFISEYFLITLVAQVLVLPLIIYHFREVSWLFLLANPLILPVQPLVMILGLLALIAGLFSVPLGQFLSWLSWPFVAYTNKVVSELARLAPNAWHLPSFSAGWLLVYYALVFLLAFRPKFKSSDKPIWQPVFALLGLGSLAIVLAVHLASRPDGKLGIKVFNNPDAPIVLVRTPKGEMILSGGATSATRLAENVSKALPPFQQNIAYLIVPGCKKAQLNGFFGLPDQMRIGTVLWACDPESSRTAQSLFSYFENKDLSQLIIDNQYLLNWSGGEMSFAIDEEGLQALMIIEADFSAVVDYGVATPSLRSDDLSLWVGKPDDNTTTCAAIMLSTAESASKPEMQCPTEFVPVSEHDWVLVSTDGQQVWLRVK